MRKKDGVQRKKRKKAPFIIIGVIAVAALAGIIAGKGKNAAAIVTTTYAVRGELQENVTTSGTVEAEEKQVFFAPVSGKIAQVNATPGDAVKSGDVLIAYDTESLENTLRQAVLQQDKSTAHYKGALSDDAQNKAKLSEANLNLSVLEQQISDNKAYLKKLQKALEDNQRETANALAAESYTLSGRMTELQNEIKALDPADTAALAAKEKELSDAQAQISRNSYLQGIVGSTDYVAEMKEEIAIVQERIAACEEYKVKMESQKSGSENSVMDSYDKTQYEADMELANISYSQAQSAYYKAKAGICAGFDGIVTQSGAVEGATVSEGIQLLTLESSDRVKVVFQASKQDVEKLAVGQKADVTVSGNTYAGTVSKINRMATLNSSNTPMVGVEVHIEEPDERIILGMDARLTVYTKTEKDVLLIPVEAVNADRDGDFLYVVEDGVIVKKTIVCGISNDTQTVVLEGITERDQIVLATVLGNPEEGAAVTVAPAQ